MPDLGGQASGWDLCVDFGSSATAAAQAASGSADTAVLPLGNDSATLRSAIYIESPERIAVGDVAYDKAQRNPTGFVPFPKFAVSQEMMHAGGFDVPAAVAISAIIGSVVERAMGSQGGSPPRRLILTHPEAWTQRQVGVLVEAARRLSLEGTEIVTRSEAHAAASYYSRSKHLPAGATIAVVDFGGGTLDAAVLRSNEDGSFTVLSSNGAADIGGRNIDALMRALLDEKLTVSRSDVLGYLRTQAAPDQLFALDNSIRRAKETLSEARSSSIVVPTPGGDPLSVEVTRPELERAIGPLIGAARDLTARTLSEGGVNSPYDLEALYLVGGSSRVPLVHRALADLGPIATLDDPKTIVAQGALGATAPVARHLAGSVGSPAGGRPADDAATDSDTTAGGDESSKRKRRLSIIAAALVCVVVLVAAGTFAVIHNSNGDGNGEAANETPAPVLPAKYEKDLRAALPAELSEIVVGCEPSGESKYGGVTFRCDVDEQKSPVKDAFKYGDGSVDLTADEGEAEIELNKVTMMTGSSYYSDAGSKLIQSPDELTAARIEGSTETSMQVSAANTELHVVLECFDFASPEKAQEFLEKTGILPTS
ncbi:Hsp70 family protein [Dietzia sp.]|uniref:Hsp70 family protein n=1 Tax=Dietzia sp. TaxID=1871616 RepID=UPI002FD88079